MLFLTLALSSVSANVSGKIKYHNACHEMFALVFIHENWHCICLITNAGLLKIIFNAHVHVPARVKSKDCKNPMSATNVQEKYLGLNQRGGLKRDTVGIIFSLSLLIRDSFSC